MRNKEQMSWGKPCRHGHVKEDGTNLRYHNICVLCEGNPRYDGLTQDEILTLLTTSTKKSPEEIAKLRSAASMRWNKKNKDKTYEYARKYFNKEERKAVVKQKRLEKLEANPHLRVLANERNHRTLLKKLGMATEEEYQAYLAAKKEERRIEREAKYGKTDDERRAIRRAKNRERYQSLPIEERRKIAKKQQKYGTDESRAAQRERQLEKAREKYYAMSPEDKKELFRKNNERARLRKQKAKDEDGSK